MEIPAAFAIRYANIRTRAGDRERRKFSPEQNDPQNIVTIGDYIQLPNSV
jgi:hypothetical protein